MSHRLDRSVLSASRITTLTASFFVDTNPTNFNRRRIQLPGLDQPRKLGSARRGPGLTPGHFQFQDASAPLYRARFYCRWLATLRYVRDHEAAIAKARPEMPAGLNDRAADIWEPLLVLADLAGDGWQQLG